MTALRLLPKDHHIYCDESQTNARYMVYGGIVVPARDVHPFNVLVEKWRVQQNMRAEMKWTKVTSQKYAKYCSLLDLFFKSSNREGLHFKSVVIDMRQVDYDTYHAGDEELGFYKFYYRFLLSRFAIYAKDETHSLRIYLDERSTRYKLTDLRMVLNRGIRKEHGLKLDVVRSVEARDSKKSNIMQIADILMGAIGWAENDLGADPASRQAKRDLATYIAKKQRMGSLKEPVPDWKNPKFEIWRWDLSKSKKKRPVT